MHLTNIIILSHQMVNMMTHYLLCNPSFSLIMQINFGILHMYLEKILMAMKCYMTATNILFGSHICSFTFMTTYVSLASKIGTTWYQIQYN